MDISKIIQEYKSVGDMILSKGKNVPIISYEDSDENGILGFHP
jgi:hypothetical protein